MHRRQLLRLSGGADSSTSPEPCTLPADADLVSLLPSASDGLTRTVNTDSSVAYLDEYRATVAVSAEYAPNTESLDDRRVVYGFRFRPEADGSRVVRRLLTDVEYDSNRVGVGVVDGRVGLVSSAPTRRQATSLLARSPALSERCLETSRLLPLETRTPVSKTARSTATSE